MKYLSKLNLCIAFISLTAFLVAGCEKSNDENQNSLNGKTTALFNSSKTYGTMTDQDGNVYKTITIGTQIWMAENLRTTLYNDGTPIPNVETQWGVLSTGACCTYDNSTDAVFIATYGRLYNWHAVNTGKLAPEGWHVASNDEWEQLIDYIGSEPGGRLKEVGTTHWNSLNVGATNETGFTALPGGYRSKDSSFQSNGNFGIWWTASETPDTFGAFHQDMRFDGSGVYPYADQKMYGFSVRCVKN